MSADDKDHGRRTSDQLLEDSRSRLTNLMLVGASEHCERATRPERAGEAARGAERRESEGRNPSDRLVWRPGCSDAGRAVQER